MPSLLEEQYKQTIKEQRSIEEKVRGEHVKASKSEQEQARLIIAEISSRFADAINEKGLENLTDEISNAVKGICQAKEIPLESRLRLENIVLMTVLGNGPIEEYLQDPTVTEVVVQRYDNIVIERRGKIEKVGAVFNNEEHLRTIIGRIVQSCNRQINIMTPIVDARLKDGSRVNATIPPASPDGATLTIRKFNQRALSGKDYLNAGSMNRAMLYFLERCVVARLNIYVSGGTGSGKTTLLNMLSQFIPNTELIITIEDTLELKLQQPNVRRMETRTAKKDSDMMNVDQKALVKAALRQRPDRIVLGETRDGSIVDLISAMSTGHEGSMSTIHANSPQNMCDVRIPILYSMNEEANFSEKSIALQIAEAIQLIVQISRFPDGSRKISHISYVDGIKDGNKVNVQDVFIYDREQKKFRPTGIVPEPVLTKMHLLGMDFEKSIFKEEI